MDIKEYRIIYHTIDGYADSRLREGTYKEVESWAEQQMLQEQWQCFGIKEDGEYTWAYNDYEEA